MYKLNLVDLILLLYVGGVANLNVMLFYKVEYIEYNYIKNYLFHFN